MKEPCKTKKQLVEEVEVLRKQLVKLKKAETKRQRAEMALMERQETINAILETSQDWIWGIDRQGVHTYSNPAIERILGYRTEEIVGRSSLDLMHEEDRKMAESTLRACEEKRCGWSNLLLRWRHKNGIYRYLESNAVPILNSNSDLIGFRGVDRDITERKQAEEALRESERKYRAVVEISPDGIAIASKGRHVFANRSLARIFGLSDPDELLGKPVLDYIHPDYHEIVRKRLEQQTKRGQLVPLIEEKLIRADGTIVHAEVTAAPLEYQGEPAALAIIRDITERKKAEEALRESEKKYRTVVEISPDGIAIASKGVHVFVNRSLARIFGLSDPAEMLGKPVLDYIHPDYQEIVRKRIETVAKGGALSPLSEEKMIRPNGRVIQTEVAVAPLEYQGEPATLAIIRDITERKQAEEKLRESEERFRLAFENANTGVCLVDFDGNLTRVNNRMCEMFGYTKQELERMTVNDIAHPEDTDKSPTFIQKTLRGEMERGTFEKRYFHKNGHVVTCQVSSSLVRDVAGAPLYFISHLHDITDRKQAEEALRQSEERYRTILDDIEEGYFEVDLAGRSTFVNDSLCKIYGYPREEFLGTDNRRFTDKENAERVYEAFNQVYRTGEPGRIFNYEIIRKDGTKRQVEVFPSLRKDSSGKPMGFRGITRDVTERKQAEEALQKEREISLSILENAPYAVALIDKGGQYIYANSEFTNITGYLLQDVPTGRDWFQKAFPDPGDRRRMLKLWKEDRSKGDMINREFSIHCKDGKICQVDFRSTFLRDGRAVVAFRDVTERQRAEEEMKSLQEQLRQSQKMEAIGRLAGGIAHDFNNLLTIIKGYSQLSLIELKEDTPLKGNIEHIHTATDRAADLVRQLLAFSRRQILEMKVWDLNTILANLNSMLRRLIGEDIELTMILGEDLGRVKTDIGWIEQAIMNLVVNARDAMPSGGKLTIETENAVLDDAYVSRRVGVKPGRFVMLSVSDTGLGMTPEVRERLFEPFFSTKEKDKGTGLGLSTVYGIVKQSDGDIWVYSEPGKGSTFKIYLPRVDEPPEQLREKASGDELLRGSETILLVEDEEEVQKLAVRVLERQGYRVLSARNGDEALLICEEHKDPIHLMLTDVVMPGMNGQELAERLRPFHPKMKVLYMSGYTDNAIVLHGVLREGVHYIQKPFTVEALARKVREVL